MTIIRIPFFLACLACTLWFLLSPTLNLFWGQFTWSSLVATLLAWVLTITALRLLEEIRRRWGLSALFLTTMSVFLFLWGLSEILPAHLLPNPYQLYRLWKGADFYSLLVYWLAGWVLSTGSILLVVNHFSLWLDSRDHSSNS